jgi:hypothetical protein
MYTIAQKGELSLDGGWVDEWTDDALGKSDPPPSIA